MNTFGIEIHEIILLLKQLGIVVAGAAALWGYVFSRMRFSCGSNECLIHDWIATKLSNLVFAGVALSVLAFVFADVYFVSAHEGIVVFPTQAELLSALSLAQPLLLLITVIAGIACFAKVYRPAFFETHIRTFFAVEFVLLLLASALLGWTGDLSGRQWFFFAHGFHSIFTLGTVIVLDYLYLLSTRSEILKQHIFSLFPTISKVVWIGLAVDFGSSLLILDSFQVTEKFLFMQTVIGILIINGTLLSGPLTKAMLEETKEGGKKVSSRVGVLASLAGTISITSWLTITVVDYFAHLTVPYAHLLAGYLLFIVILFVGHEVLVLWEKRKSAPVFVH